MFVQPFFSKAHTADIPTGSWSAYQALLAKVFIRNFIKPMK